MKPIIEVNHVWKEYQKGINRRYKSLRDTLVDIPGKLFGNETEKFWALEDIDFKVEAGESIGIIGHNGAGKSTLLKILSRITPPTKGEIILRGRVASLLEVGTGFHPELTGRENIYFNGSILGMKNQEIKRKFDEIIAFSGIENFIDTPLKHYSSGMQMRLAFSVAAHLETEIIVIDEILAVGDVEFQKKCIGKMDEVSKKESKTILFVSHDMAVLKNLCQTSILLKKGKVMEIGKIDSVADIYLNGQIERQGRSFVNVNTNRNSYINYCNIISSIQTGSPLVIELQLYCNQKMNADIAIGFRGLDNAPILQIFSGHSSDTLQLNSGQNTVKIKIDQLLITSGWYFLNLWFGQGTHELDFHVNVMQVYVQEGALNKNLPNVVYRNYHNLSNAKWEITY